MGRKPPNVKIRLMGTSTPLEIIGDTIRPAVKLKDLHSISLPDT